MQEKSGARIKVSRNDDGAYEVNVQISGDTDKQAAAEALIKELLIENPYSSNKVSYSAAPAAMIGAYFYRLEHNNVMTSHYQKDENRSIYNPVRKFSQAFVHYPENLQTVSSQEFSAPSPIQCQSWPV